MYNSKYIRFGLPVLAIVIAMALYYDTRSQPTKLSWDLDRARETALTPPDDEDKFVSVLEKYHDLYSQKPDEPSALKLREARRPEICAVLKGWQVQGWTGKIMSFKTNVNGKGILSIAIGPHVSVSTEKTGLADKGFATMLEPNGDLFQQVSHLKQGQWVRFSGQFFASTKDCMHEQSWILRTAMSEPEFTIKFTSVDTPSGIASK